MGYPGKASQNRQVMGGTLERVSQDRLVLIQPLFNSLSPNKESLGYPHQESSAIRVHMMSLESEVSKWPGSYMYMRIFFRVFFILNTL